MFGLSTKTYNQILDIVKKHKYEFILFGSRARGNYKINSDIDIAILGEVNQKEEYIIRNEFDLLDIPYTIDIIFVNKETKKELIESIKNEGVKL